MELVYQFTPKQIIEEGRTTKENIAIIRDWLTHLEDKNVPPNIQDETIVLFLLSCNNNIDLTKKTVVAFYKCKKNGPELYDDRDVEGKDIQLALTTVQLSSIPVRTDENYVVHFFRIQDTNYKNFDQITIMKISYMLLDISHEKNPPNGLIVLIDVKGFGLMHMTTIRLEAIKKYLQFLQEGFPMQMKAIHILNADYFMDKIMTIIKVFLKSDLLKMLHLHRPGLEPEKLYKLIPKKCLPKEYGGDLPSTEKLHQVTLSQFREKQSFWDMEEKLRKQHK